jgi:drug/metabolite transporter (DMT)-like permease
LTIHTASVESVGKGIGCMVGGVFLYTIADTATRWLGLAGFDSPQIVFFRYLIGMLPVVAMVWIAGAHTLRTRRPWAHAFRAGLLFVALMAFTTGLRVIPLAEAVSIVFTVPLFIAALSRPVLGEHVGPRRWAAVAVGFVGALIMLRPGTAAFRPDALWILFAALCFAVAMLYTRRMAATETNVAMFAYSNIGALLASLPLIAVTWREPSLDHMWGFMILGIAGSFAALLMIIAYRNAPAAVVAPFEYTALIWAVLFGWMMWGEHPAPAVWVGAAVIVLSGLYITRREAVGARGP